MYNLRDVWAEIMQQIPRKGPQSASIKLTILSPSGKPSALPEENKLKTES